MTAIQAIHVRSFEERTTPKSHFVYRIEIQAHVRSWQMWHRYSEFDDLHTELIKTTGSAPPCELPPKHRFALLRSRDTKILEERRIGLEQYLRAILSAKEDRWRESLAFRDFLGIPTGKQSLASPAAAGGAGGTQYTMASWLDEHVHLQALIRDVRSEVAKRDALADKGDISASHKANVGAKAKLAGILSRIGTLGEGLRELGMHGMKEGELQRRTDMVARLQDDCEKLGKMVTIARQWSNLGDGLSASGRRAASETDREALLGSATRPLVIKPITRVFGASQPKETEVTRPLDSQGLLSLQQTQVQLQDNQLTQLTTILRRQRQLGEAINSEIASQIEMLDDLSNDVDGVSAKLATTNKQLNKLG